MPSYAGRMARSHLTLAALATSAVPDLDVVATRAAGAGVAGRFDSAILRTRDGHELIVRVPASDAAEIEQSGDLVAQASLTHGARSRLPFVIPRPLGQAPIGSTRGVVYEYLPGEVGSQALVESDPELALAVGEAIAAIHSLPTSVISDVGLPVLSASEARQATAAVRDRAAATGLVPTSLLSRWSSAIDDATLWQFQPAVIHGGLGPECLLVMPPEVVAVLDWQSLKVGDPASDLYWVSSFHDEAIGRALFERYSARRTGPEDRQLRKRARLYAELEIAKWLMHGVDSHDKAVVDDAVSMLRGLASTTQSDLLNPLSTDTGQVLDVAEVESLLDRTPRTASAAYGSRPSPSGISED